MPVLEYPYYGPFRADHAEKRLPQRDKTRKRGSTVSASADGGTSVYKGDVKGEGVKAATEKD